MLPTAPIYVLTQNGVPSEQGGAPTETTAGEPAAGSEPAGQDAPSSSPFGFLGPIAIIFVIFWILIIGPERKARKKQEAMRGALKKGDEVMTTGGMFGKIASIDEEKVVLQIADNVRVRYLRNAIQGRVGDEFEAKDGKEKANDKANDKAKPKEAEPKLEPGED
ncbi:MAG: preprotein translocase subunit YajC [Planctomycetota bacterium]|nr:preprotein translocase subunit YajC [Planctomycetota bacterium]